MCLYMKKTQQTLMTGDTVFFLNNYILNNKSVLKSVGEELIKSSVNWQQVSSRVLQSVWLREQTASRVISTNI